MPNTLEDILLVHTNAIEKPIAPATYNTLHKLAFENAAQAIIITHPLINGNLLKANNAACKLLGYTKKELLTKSRADIFEVQESSFKKMLRQRNAGGQSTAFVTGIKKSGKLFSCEVTSAVFTDEDGKTFAITTIADMSESIRRQNRIDTKNKKIVADNIVLAKCEQKEIDTKNKKRESHNIVLAKSAQKKIDTRNEKTVADNIDLAKCEQKLIDAQNEKTVADNIILAQAKSDARLAENNEHNRELEDKLEREMKLKDKQIVDAAEDAKETERSDIGKELHDNINQLLSASRMYLEMAKRGGVDSKMYLRRSSEYMLTAIDEIRKLTKGLTTDFIKNLGLCEAIEIIARDTMEIKPLIISTTLGSFDEDSVHDKFKLNVYRIVQEQLNNILKHAIATEVNISLLQNKRSILLSISDNGVGFDTGKKQKGIGIDNIKSRALTYKGMAEFVSQPGHGCVLNVRFPLTDGLQN